MIGDGSGESSSYAREGTFAHAVAAYILTTDKTPKAESEFTFMDHDEEIVGKITEEMLEHVQLYVNHIRQHGQKGVIKVEQRVDLSSLVRDAMFGTCDALIVKSDELVISDFKYGYYPVHLVNLDLLLTGGELSHINSQLLYYAAGAAHEYEWKHKRIVLEIIQPRCMEVSSIQSVLIGRKQLRNWAENDLWKAAHLATSENAPLAAGDWCRFCPALPVCPEARRTVQDLAAVDFADLNVKPIETPEHVTTILKWAPIIDAWLRACEAHALQLMLRGVNVPGFKLVEKRANRRWPENMSNEEIYKKLKAAGGAGNIKHFITTDFLSPAKAEKIAGKNPVNAVAIHPKGDLTIAAESDRRSTASVVSDFKEFTNEESEKN